MTKREIENRLQEIAATSLQDLDDQVVLALLTERKELLLESARLEQQEREEAEKRKAAVAKQEALQTRIAEINKAITPLADADQLLALVQERKDLEAELQALAPVEAEAPVPEPVEKPIEKKPLPPAAKTKKKKEAEPAVAPVPQEQEETSELKSEPKTPEPEPAAVEEASPAIPEVSPAVPEAMQPVVPQIEDEPKEDVPISIQSDTPHTQTYTSKTGKLSALEGSSERVVLDSSLQTSEYQGYLSELKANLNSLGTFLQTLPIDAKRNRAFMLEVAKIDPAYAMHYADKDTLKKDEAFNLAVAGMNNQRNTGNPLSEMLPEMRTGAVVLVGVKNDYRNVRFVKPEMPEYEAIIQLAQKGALEAVSALKGAHDVRTLIPPILQKDKAFMAAVAKVTG